MISQKVFALLTSIFPLSSSLSHLPTPIFQLPSSNSHLPTPIFHLPSSIFHLPIFHLPIFHLLSSHLLLKICIRNSFVDFYSRHFYIQFETYILDDIKRNFHAFYFSIIAKVGGLCHLISALF